ncbi:hypothetical protein MUK42_08620 [Musa troglodytarum]|uniref:Uncharacterized protein n=1 Tax=Musa troglodytarum TaxID=320322 RepID=A0A9E7I408_9LILI|nr:hypothetical protein MUK42_08620 [Musa troglodytarum]
MVSPYELLSTIEMSLPGSSSSTSPQRIELILAMGSSIPAVKSLFPNRPFRPPHSPRIQEAFTPPSPLYLLGFPTTDIKWKGAMVSPHKLLSVDERGGSLYCRRTRRLTVLSIELINARSCLNSTLKSHLFYRVLGCRVPGGPMGFNSNSKKPGLRIRPQPGSTTPVCKFSMLR